MQLHGQYLHISTGIASLAHLPLELALQLDTSSHAKLYCFFFLSRETSAESLASNFGDGELKMSQHVVIPSEKKLFWVETNRFLAWGSFSFPSHVVSERQGTPSIGCWAGNSQASYVVAFWW